MTQRAISPIRAVKRGPSLHHDVQEAIKSYIIANALKPGDPLPPETALAHQMGVSRNSIREAVKSLAAVGIVEPRPGSGLFVHEFSLDSILDNFRYGTALSLEQITHILDLRLCIELGLAERVVASVEHAQIETLRHILAGWRLAAERGEYLEGDDRSFHQALYSNVDNPLMARVIDVFWMTYRLALERAPVVGDRDPVETYTRHARIAEALTKRDHVALRSAITDHYAATERRAKLAQELERQAKTKIGS